MEDCAEKFDSNKATTEQLDTWREVFTILKQADYDYERNQLNTIVSGCMKLLNLLTKIPSDTGIDQIIMQAAFKILLSLLAPIAPHICQQLWSDLNFGDMIVDAAWPKVISSALNSKTVHLIVQVNGKLRSKISVPHDADHESIQAAALADTAVLRHVENKTIQKVVIVPNRLVNIVVTENPT